MLQRFVVVVYIYWFASILASGKGIRPTGMYSVEVYYSLMFLRKQQNGIETKPYSRQYFFPISHRQLLTS